jgi:tRNA A58 N-methylase Trm61
MDIVYLVIYVLILLLLFSFAYGAISGAPWVPTKKDDIRRVVELAGIKKGEKFYEMGSGDGRLGSAIVNSGGKSFGYEVAILPYLVSRIRGLFLNNYKMMLKSFWNADISDADYVYVFLRPERNERIAEKLMKEMKKGSKVIAYVWPFKGWDPLKVDKKEDRVNIYLYEI